MPETTPEAEIMFWEPFRLNVGILKDICSNNTYFCTSSSSCNRKSTSSSSSSVASSTTEITTPPNVIDIKKMSRVRLLANISALGELVAKTKQTSPVAKRIFWEAIKLEIKTLRDLDENVYLRATEKGEEQEASAVSAASPPLQKHASTTTYKEVVASDDSCTATKSIYSHSSPSTSARALCFTPPSSPQNNKEKKTTTVTTTAMSSVGKHKSWRSRVRSFPSLRRFVPLLASPTHFEEWLRSSQPIQDTGVMEMIFYHTTTAAQTQEGACTITSNQ